MPEEKKSDNTAFYVAIGAFVALIVIIIIFVIWYYNDGSSSDPQPGTNVTKAVASRSSSSSTSSSASAPTSPMATGAMKATSAIKKVIPFASSSSSSPLTPVQVMSAYASSVAGYTPNGTGRKIAIIVAYNNPTIQSDLNKFCTTYGLPAKTLILHNLGATNPPNNSDVQGWQYESNLDTQYATLMAPNASVYVVFAASDSLGDLNSALTYANSTIKPDIITMSWGIDENELNSSDATYFEPQFSGSKASASFYLASSGDGVLVSYPSSSNNVISVGGTSLSMTGNVRSGETLWATADSLNVSDAGDGTGQGLSQFFTKPSYQSNVNSSNFKLTPDISLVANSIGNTGVIIIHQGLSYGVLGTSLSSPLFAGILATSIAYRASKGKTAFTQATLMSKLYGTDTPTGPTNPLIGIGAVNQTFTSFVANA